MLACIPVIAHSAQDLESLAPLLVVMVEDSRPVLAEFIRADAPGSESAQIFLYELRESELVRIIEDLHRLGVPGPAAANVLVSGVFRGPAGVARSRVFDSFDLLKRRLNAPESPGGKGRFVEIALVGQLGDGSIFEKHIEDHVTCANEEN